MKPSRRRDSLAQKRPGRLGDIEKAARKEAEWWMDFARGKKAEYPTWNEVIAAACLRFAQRHGAKVRRECAELALGYTKGDRQLYEMILSLTPRGPEKS